MIVAQHIKLVCIPFFEDGSDWYKIERAEHAGQRFYAEVHAKNDGFVFGANHAMVFKTLITSARLGQGEADIEGTKEEMLSLATAIAQKSRASFTRCAVEWHEAGVDIYSPKNTLFAKQTLSYESAAELVKVIFDALT